MFGARHLVTCLFVLGAIVLSIPVAALASGGGSAGDNQYTDPFAGSTASHTATAPHTTSAPAPAPAPAPAYTAPATVPQTTVAQVTPTATYATTATYNTTAATASSQSLTSLPYTGYADWLAGGLGLVLVGGGVALRLKFRGA